MSENFKLGSIAELVDQTGTPFSSIKKKNVSTKKSRKRKLNLTSTFEVTEINDNKNTLTNSAEEKSTKKKKEKGVKQVIEVNDEIDIKDKTKIKTKKTSPNGKFNDIRRKKVVEREKKLNDNRQQRQLRTLFVGNIPANFQLKNLKKTFESYGKIKSIRTVANMPKVSKLDKDSLKNINTKNVNAYIVFKDIESVEQALKINGQNFEGNIIHVDRCGEENVYDGSLSLFLGNLSFKITENELYEFFKDCGEIYSVRLVRDGKTGMGKGFGYINFKSKDSVVLALEKNGQALKNREIRIKAYTYNQEMKRMDNKLANGGKKLAKKFKQSISKKVDTNFQGEKSNKNIFKKKSLKKRLNESRVKKQKRMIGQIFSK